METLTEEREPGLFNLTPHDVTIENLGTICRSGIELRSRPEYGDKFEIETSIGKVSVVEIKCYHIPEDAMDDALLKIRTLGALPGDILLVSTIVADALAKSPAHTLRDDYYFLVPDSGPNSVIRDEKGQIVGVKRLINYL